MLVTPLTLTTLHIICILVVGNAEYCIYILYRSLVSRSQSIIGLYISSCFSAFESGFLRFLFFGSDLE
ncbi:hypothetical protein BC943DRAFT_322451 [Umbelopsis sp. AD052]|nr:hypothetical protein BC943DRAFT_322451 [Umbelopsis sp. AD052]